MTKTRLKQAMSNLTPYFEPVTGEVISDFAPSPASFHIKLDEGRHLEVKWPKRLSPEEHKALAAGLDLVKELMLLRIQDEEQVPEKMVKK